MGRAPCEAGWDWVSWGELGLEPGHIVGKGMADGSSIDKR